MSNYLIGFIACFVPLILGILISIHYMYDDFFDTNSIIPFIPFVIGITTFGICVKILHHDFKKNEIIGDI